MSYPIGNPHRLTIKFEDADNFIIDKLYDFIIHAPKMFNSHALLLNKKLYHYLLQQQNSSIKSATFSNHQAIQTGEELAALMITIMNTPDAEPRPAMGYNGPMRGKQDIKMRKLIRSGKVILVDQSNYLLHHSGMRIPNKNVFENIYRKSIFQEKSYNLGRYKNSRITQ